MLALSPKFELLLCFDYCQHAPLLVSTPGVLKVVAATLVQGYRGILDFLLVLAVWKIGKIGKNIFAMFLIGSKLFNNA